MDRDLSLCNKYIPMLTTTNLNHITSALKVLRVQRCFIHIIGSSLQLESSFKHL